MRQRQGAGTDHPNIADGLAAHPAKRALHLPKWRQDDRPGCACGWIGVSVTEFSGVPAYNPRAGDTKFPALVNQLGPDRRGAGFLLVSIMRLGPRCRKQNRYQKTNPGDRSGGGFDTGGSRRAPSFILCNINYIVQYKTRAKVVSNKDRQNRKDIDCETYFSNLL